MAATWVHKNYVQDAHAIFWPQMREGIKTQVVRCAYYVSYNFWRTRKSEMDFSWPITVPFWGHEYGLVIPYVIEDTSRENGFSVNSMCNLTKFIVSSPSRYRCCLSCTALRVRRDHDLWDV